jgi:hypothetical protein
MIIHLGTVQPKMQEMELAHSIEMASTYARAAGREADAMALFRLRIKIREGLSYEEAKVIFDQHTEGLFTKNS